MKITLDTLVAYLKEDHLDFELWYRRRRYSISIFEHHPTAMAGYEDHLMFNSIGSLQYVIDKSMEWVLSHRTAMHTKAGVK
jgi:hypothetical protein